MHEMPDRFDERDLDAMLDGREPSGLDNRWIRQASAESRPPELASDVLADEVRQSHDAPMQEMGRGEATGDKVIVPTFIFANAQWGIEYRLVMN
jgi:hypothetical protein